MAQLPCWCHRHEAERTVEEQQPCLGLLHSRSSRATCLEHFARSSAETEGGSLVSLLCQKAPECLHSHPSALVVAQRVPPRGARPSSLLSPPSPAEPRSWHPRPPPTSPIRRSPCSSGVRVLKSSVKWCSRWSGAQPGPPQVQAQWSASIAVAAEMRELSRLHRTCAWRRRCPPARARCGRMPTAADWAAARAGHRRRQKGARKLHCAQGHVGRLSAGLARPAAPPPSAAAGTGASACCGSLSICVNSARRWSPSKSGRGHRHHRGSMPQRQDRVSDQAIDTMNHRELH